MQKTASSIFEDVRNNLAMNAALVMGDGIIDQCDVSCLCVNRTMICDSRSERNGCIGENVSDKGARSTMCDAAAYLPENTTDTGTIC